MILRCPDGIFLSRLSSLASWSLVVNEILVSVCVVVVVLTSTSGCPEAGLDFSLLVSRGWIRFLIFRCPEVVSYFVIFVVVAAAAVSVVIWRYAIGRSLSIWNARMMQLIISFGRTLAKSREELVVVCSACGFQIAIWVQDTMGELSRGVRGVVFVFDLLLNFKFVF